MSRLSLVCLLGLLGSVNTLRAQVTDSSQKLPPPATLVQQMVDNELSPKPQTAFRYTMDSVTKDRVETYLVIETPEGTVKLLIAVNGEPPSPQDVRRSQEKLDKFLSDPEERQKRLKADHDDGQRAERMLKELPHGFLYEYESVNESTITLSFQPNPAYHPPTREARVFHAMAGTLVIDAKQKRLLRLQGELISDVDFGMGLLAHLKRGGTFMVEQHEVMPNCWTVTHLVVRMEGRAALFSNINVHDDWTLSHFSQVPPDLSLERAAALLKENPLTQ